MSRLDVVQNTITRIERLHKELFHKKPRIGGSRFYFGQGEELMPKPIRSIKAADQYKKKFDRLRALTKELYGKHGAFVKEHGLSVDIQ